MGICTTCGNHYDNTFEIIQGDFRGEFDSFECAIAKCAPECRHCGCRILGHGVEDNGQSYCCSHCAREAGASATATDRLDNQP
jgi:hypothetical protein